jgi:hypothetical protein
LVPTQTEIADVILNLMLLQDDLISSVRFGSQPYVVCRRESFLSAEITGDSAHMALDGRALKAVVRFLLMYFRDGEGEVDHIDIGLPAEAGDVDLTVRVPNARRPMSAEDAARALGIDSPK